MSPHIMVYGNPVDGFRFVGPFETKRQAHTYATTESADAWVAELDAPAHEQARAHRKWTFVIKETAEGFNYETNCLGGGFSPTRKGLIEVIGRMIETYLPLPLPTAPEKTQPTAVDAYAAWLANQPKPKTMAEALAQLPPGVTGVMMDPDKPEIVHNAIAEAVGERYHQLPPSQTINQEGEWK